MNFKQNQFLHKLKTFHQVSSRSSNSAGFFSGSQPVTRRVMWGVTHMGSVRLCFGPLEFTLNVPGSLYRPARKVTHDRLL